MRRHVKFPPTAARVVSVHVLYMSFFLLLLVPLQCANALCKNNTKTRPWSRVLLIIYLQRVSLGWRPTSFSPFTCVRDCACGPADSVCCARCHSVSSQKDCRPGDYGFASSSGPSPSHPCASSCSRGMGSTTWFSLFLLQLYYFHYAQI